MSGASVRVICAEAGVSPGLLTHYFEGIDQLILETYRQVGEQLAEALDRALCEAPQDPRSQIHAYIATSFRPPVLDRDLLSVWVVFWSLIRSNESIRRMHDEIYGQFRQKLVVQVRLALGDRASDDKVRLMTVALTALTDGLWLELCLDNPSFTAEEATAVAIEWLENQLDKA
jgi:AcrR family transcriptional regulator